MTQRTTANEIRVLESSRTEIHQAKSFGGGGAILSADEKLPVRNRPSFNRYAVHLGRTPDVGF